MGSMPSAFENSCMQIGHFDDLKIAFETPVLAGAWQNGTTTVFYGKGLHASNSFSYSQAQVYEVVSNVTDYHRFIPFCTHSRVFSSKSVTSAIAPGRVVMEAELGVGFNMFNEKYTSKVTCDKPKQVKAEAVDAALFKELTTTWRFTPNVTKIGTHSEPASHHPSCWVDFSIAFEFASPLHAHASGVFFDKVSSMMMDAFIERCAQVYGKR